MRQFAGGRCFFVGLLAASEVGIDEIDDSCSRVAFYGLASSQVPLTRWPTVMTRVTGLPRPSEELLVLLAARCRDVDVVGRCRSRQGQWHRCNHGDNREPCACPHVGPLPFFGCEDEDHRGTTRARTRGTAPPLNTL